MRTTPLLLLSFAVALTSPATARADQCAEIRNHISQLDRTIANDHIKDSRELRIRDRSNWVRAYNQICTGSGGGLAGGTMSSRERNATALGAAIGVIGTLRDILRESEVREQQEAAVRRFEQAHEAFEREARSVPDQSFTVIHESNPRDSSAWWLEMEDIPEPSASSSRDQQSGFPTDEEIKAMCASNANPSACEMGEQSARNFNPAYQQWRREASRAQDRNIEAAEAELDRAIEDHRRKRAEAADTPGGSNFPIAGFDQAPTTRGKDGYEECRKGAARSDTVVSCYEHRVGTGTGARAEPGGGEPAADDKEARRRLREALSRRSPRGFAGTQPDSEPAQPVVPDAPAVTAAPQPGVQVAAAPAVMDPGPPSGYRREVIDETLCKQWLGKFFTPPGSSIPVCEYPENPYSNVEGENEQIVRELVDEGERELGIGPYAKPSH